MITYSYKHNKSRIIFISFILHIEITMNGKYFNKAGLILFSYQNISLNITFLFELLTIFCKRRIIYSKSEYEKEAYYKVNTLVEYYLIIWSQRATSYKEIQFVNIQWIHNWRNVEYVEEAMHSCILTFSVSLFFVEC